MRGESARSSCTAVRCTHFLRVCGRTMPAGGAGVLFNRMESGRASISDAVYMEVITGLHGTTIPTILAGVCQAMVGAITTYETGDTVTAALTVAGVVVAIVRLFEIAAFRRRLAQPPQLDRAEAARWERRYISGTVMTALVL